jgi:putative SOS response-associated peptidase YedK
MGPNGEEMETAAIVTTKANRALAGICERMPVIVPPDAFDLWLDGGKVDAETASAVIAPAPEQLLEAYAISPAVNQVANDSPELLVPLAATAASDQPADAAEPARKPKRKDDGQASLF